MLTLGWLAIAAALAQTPPAGGAPRPTGAVFAPDEQGLAMRVRPVADGLAREGSWTALRVTLLNIGPSTKASLSYQETSSDGEQRVAYRRDIELTQAAKKEVVLPIEPGANASGVRQLVLTTDDGRALARAYKLDLVAPTAVTVGVIGQDALGINALGTTWAGPVPGRAWRTGGGGSPRDVRAGLIDPKGVPDRSVGFDALDWVVWPSADPSALDAEQGRALSAWVADGGHLLVTVTDTAPAWAGAPLADVLPVEVRGVAPGSLQALTTTLGGGDGAVVPVGTAVVRDVPGRDVWTLQTFDDGRPAWVIGTYGLGTVSVLLADPAMQPLHGGTVTREALWRRLLWLPPAQASVGWYRLPGMPGDASFDSAFHVTDYYNGSGWNLPASEAWPSDEGPLSLGLASALHLTTSSSAQGLLNTNTLGLSTPGVWEEDLRERLNDIPGVAPLPLSWLLLFSVAYLLFVGPIDYVVLRAIGRQPWTWLTFPLYVGGFSALALLGTAWQKGSQAAVVRVELVDALPGTDLWRGESWIGVFATSKSDLSLRAGFENGAVAPLSRETGAMWQPEVYADEGPGAMSWRAETWTLGYARTRWSADGLGGISVTANADNTGVIVTNHGPVDLVDAQLLVRSNVYPLGPVKRGETRDFPNLAGTESYHAVETWGSADLDVRTALPDEILEWASARQAVRPTRGRGEVEPQWAHSTLLAYSDDSVEPMALSGLTPDTRQVTVLRVPVDPSVGASLAAATGAGPLAVQRNYEMGTVFKIRSVHRDDSNSWKKKQLIGHVCVASQMVYPVTGSWYGGSASCSDGETYYFNQWQLEIISAAPEIPTEPVYPGGSVVDIVDVEPPDANVSDRAVLIGQRCSVASEMRPSTAGGAFRGDAQCGPNAEYRYFERVKLTLISKPTTHADKTLVRVADVGTGDTLYNERGRWIGRTCVSSGDLYPDYSGQYHSGTLVCGNDWQYFYQVKVDVQTPPGATDAVVPPPTEPAP